MYCIIAGSRTITDRELVFRVIEESGFVPEIEKVIWGCAPGVDTIAKEWADTHGVPDEPMPADWDNLNVAGAIIRRRINGSFYNAAAGVQRNGRMAERANALIVIWDGHSRGSASMLRIARHHQKSRSFRIYSYIVGKGGTHE